MPYETSYVKPAVPPSAYPVHGGFPYLNLAKWHDIPYSEVLLIPATASFEIVKDVFSIAANEAKRSRGEFGPMPYGV